MPRYARLFLLALTLWACTGPTLCSRGVERHNYLEAFNSQNSKFKPETSIVIKCNISELSRNGEWVEVSWSGVSKPKEADMLALFAPPDAYHDGAAPVKYAYANSSANYIKTGSGSMSFRLVNLRSDVRFVFVKGGIDKPSVVAEGPAIKNVNPNEPTGIHLIISSRSSEMLVQWTTRDVGTPVVKYGKTRGEYDYQVPGVTDTYSKEDMCGEPASSSGWIDPGLLHTAAMSGLEPDTQYFYIVGDEVGGRDGGGFLFFFARFFRCMNA
jgi:acid phosphatase type 7